MSRYILILFLLIIPLGCDSAKTEQPQRPEGPSATSQAPETEKLSQPQPETAGSIFGEPIPLGNYYFVRRVVSIFGTPWGGVPATVEQLQKRIEQDLLLSFVAFQRNITVSQEELEAEITKTIEGQKVSFQWKNDPESYAQWIQETLKQPVDLFENQMRHLVQLKKLHQQVLDSIEPTVTQEEAFQKFLNEYNTLSVELVQFDTRQEAEDFYRKAVEGKEFWEKAAQEDKSKPREESSFRRPGFVSLEFLMDLWQFPKDAVYAMIEKEPGYIHPPESIYKGYGVFKVLEVRRADEAEFEKREESYYDQLRTKKKHEGFKEWLETLRRESDLTITVPLPQPASDPAQE